MRKYLFCLILLVTIPMGGPLWSADLTRPFSASCRDVNVHGFRFSARSSGEVIGREWSTREEFLDKRPWLFVWSPPSSLTLDGKKLVVLDHRPDFLVGLEFSRNSIAVSATSYALNYALKSAVAAKVNTYKSGLAEGIKTQSIEFNCRFKFQN